MDRRFYIASKTIHAPKWKALRAAGYPIISTWIDEAGAGETLDLSDLWRRCVVKASTATRLICYREPGESLKGAFIEIGAALASAVPVTLVGDFEGMSFAHHTLVNHATTIKLALEIDNG